MSRRALLVWILGPSIAFVVILVRFARQSRELTKTKVELLKSAAALEGERSHAVELSRVLASVPIGDPVLYGDTIYVTPRPATRRDHQLIVVLSPECGACMRALPLLDSLETAASGVVIGATFGVAKAELVEYVDRTRMPFPVVASPEGELARRLPRHATPVFVLRVGSNIESLDIGIPSAHRVARLRSRLRELAIDRSSLR